MPNWRTDPDLAEIDPSEEPEEYTVPDSGLSELDAPHAEAPEADYLEQHSDVLERDGGWPDALPDEAVNADAAEQARVVEADEDEYR
jgi:hypothetical protein